VIPIIVKLHAMVSSHLARKKGRPHEPTGVLRFTRALPVVTAQTTLFHFVSSSLKKSLRATASSGQALALVGYVRRPSRIDKVTMIVYDAIKMIYTSCASADERWGK
jgi:hypothetical protein